MKTICWVLSLVTCFTFLTGLFLLPMDYAVAKKEGKAANKGQGPSGHSQGGDKGKWAEGKGSKGKSTKEKAKESIKEELEDVFGEGKGSDKRPPGWDKGNKTGWGDGDMPPGLSRKGEGSKDKSIKEKAKEKIEETMEGVSKTKE